MIQPINNTLNKNRDTFGTKKKNVRHFDVSIYRNHQKQPVSMKNKIAIGMGSALGTFLPILYIAKYQKKGIFKFKYGLKEMIFTSSGGIIGGVGVGIAVDKKANRKQKLNEGVFQFMNATIPPLVVTPFIALCERLKPLNNVPVKIASIVGGLTAGMILAAKFSNNINDPQDIVPDRKLTAKDSVANLDDALGVVVLAKLPFAKHIHIEKLLPVIYSWCGYRAGKSN